MSCSRPCSSDTTIQHQSARAGTTSSASSRTCSSMSRVPERIRPASASSCSRWFASRMAVTAVARSASACSRETLSAICAASASRTSTSSVANAWSVDQSGTNAPRMRPSTRSGRAAMARMLSTSKPSRTAGNRANASSGLASSTRLPCIAAYWVGWRVVQLDLDTGDRVLDVALDLVGEPVGHVQPQRPGVGLEDGQRTGLRAEHLRAALHDLRQVLHPRGVGQLGGDLGDRRRALHGRQPLGGLPPGVGDVEDRAEQAYRLAAGIGDHPAAGDHPAHGAVDRQRPELGRELAVLLHRALHGLLQRGGVVPVHEPGLHGVLGLEPGGSLEAEEGGAALVPVDGTRCAGRVPRCRSSWPPGPRSAG